MKREYFCLSVCYKQVLRARNVLGRVVRACWKQRTTCVGKDRITYSIFSLEYDRYCYCTGPAVMGWEEGLLYNNYTVCVCSKLKSAVNLERCNGHHLLCLPLKCNMSPGLCSVLEWMFMQHAFLFIKIKYLPGNLLFRFLTFISYCSRLFSWSFW